MSSIHKATFFPVEELIFNLGLKSLKQFWWVAQKTLSSSLFTGAKTQLR
jgi:hypothetical protein